MDDQMSRSVRPSKSRDDVKRVAAQLSEVVQRVVAVARPFAADDEPRLPRRGRHPQHLGLAEVRGPGVERVAGDVVDREAVALAMSVREPHRDRPGHGAGDGGADVARPGAAERRGHLAGPAVRDGRTLVTFTSPPSVFRPKSALCGPRTNSICSTSSSSMLDELELSCGTPSMYVVMPGFEGLDPMPRTNRLLIFRADNSTTRVFGENATASPIVPKPAPAVVSPDTAVTLTGRRLGSAGSFCAVTTTVGNVTVGAAGGWGACAADAAIGSARRSQKPGSIAFHYLRGCRDRTDTSPPTFPAAR